ncbi:MAG: cysteine desulfurase [Coriobacteriales bacterium]|nr:cysteine desulfurase [Coriobacteriales bacterium]
MQKPIKDYVYLDYAATHPLKLDLLEEARNFCFANPSSLHTPGRDAFKILQDARKMFCDLLNAHNPSEIYFTSGGTESANTAIKGLLPANAPKDDIPKTHIVVSSIEHKAVIESALFLKRYGYKIDYVKCNKQGFILADDLDRCLSEIEKSGDKCAIVAVMALNNEISTIQPVKELVQVAHAHHSLFYCDAVQALGKIPIDLKDWEVDALGLSAHKIGALNGNGLLYIKSGTKCQPLVYGGGQENGLRSGTSNHFGSHVFALAAKDVSKNLDSINLHCEQLKAQLIDGIAKINRCAKYQLNYLDLQIDSNTQSPQILPFMCDGIEGNDFVLKLDSKQIAVSSGSACSNHSNSDSYVLRALNNSKLNNKGFLRISISQETINSDIDYLLECLKDILS